MSSTTAAFLPTHPLPWPSPSSAPSPSSSLNSRRVIRRPRHFTHPQVTDARMKLTKTPSKPTKPSSSSNVVSTLTELNTRVQTIKCPFWRRRFTDTVDMALQVAIWAIRTRHKSLPVTLPLPVTARSPSGANGKCKPKTKHLHLDTRVNIIRDDFLKRQYYVTGRLTASLYRDDCLFDSPDPDGHVRGLAKFCNAAAGLFDTRLSRVDLIDIYTIDESTIVAEWRLQGALMLPWRPYIKPYVGETAYSFDEDGLVYSHVDKWQISVADAFLSVVFKDFGKAPAPPASALRHEKRENGSLHWVDENSP